MPNLVKVNIQTGQVLENNLRQLWAGLSGSVAVPAAECHPGKHTQPAALPDEVLRERIKLFNTRRQRSNIKAWSDAELYRLALLMGKQKRNYKQAAARLARTPRACQFMFRAMTKAGVLKELL